MSESRFAPNGAEAFVSPRGEASRDAMRHPGPAEMDRRVAVADTGMRSEAGKPVFIMPKIGAASRYPLV